MAEYDGVYVFRPADGEGVPCHFDDGDGKMYQNAYCQQDFDAQHDAEGAVEWVVQYRQVAVVHHHDAADEQGNDDRRHYTDGTIGHGTFDFAARFARNAAGVQNGENQHFEKYAADKGNRAINVDDVCQCVDTHDGCFR